MATKRKPTPSRTKAAKTSKKGAGAPAKKSPARTAAKKITRPKAGSPRATSPKSAPARAATAKPMPPAKAVPARKAMTGGKPMPAGKPMAAGKALPAGKPMPAGKLVPAGKAAPGMKFQKFQKGGLPAKGGKAGRPGAKFRVVGAPPVVRPIGALPPEAVARAIRAVPPLPPRPARPAAPVRKPAPASGSDPGAAGVTEKDHKEFEQRLLAERAKILKEMGHLENTVLKVNQRESAGDLSGYSFHMADVGTDAMEREKAFMFASNEGHLLQEIDHALRKLYRGEFGPCENCSRPITRARLEAMPYARLCLPCKEEEERSNRGPL